MITKLKFMILLGDSQNVLGGFCGNELQTTLQVIALDFASNKINALVVSLVLIRLTKISFSGFHY